ncbi:MAG: M1 family metallopeptidase [Gemmatimonadota bacterium]
MNRSTMRISGRGAFLVAAGVLVSGGGGPLFAQASASVFSHADTLRGANGPARAWWDVTFYDLSVRVSPADSSVAGSNRITYRVLARGREMQIDLQRPMRLDSVVLSGAEANALALRQDGNAWFVSLPAVQMPGEHHTVTAYFHGRPTVAVRPPWDGGLQWVRDAEGRPWIATSNQGLGASVWWPNKDLQAEEPDSQRISVTVPTGLTDVSNGRLRAVTENRDGTTTYEWFVSNPINNYSVAVNAGAYAHWSESFDGEDGGLTLDFWPLEENLERARAQWSQVPSVLRCFESWFGPYPFYGDGFKLVEVPYLGMEHQSAVAYGNGYMNGYRGTDLSGTGFGLQWDFIIVHESAHEWWGNNITAADIAENWIHEGFAAYAESLYTECLTGSVEAGAAYVRGTRARIVNDRPVIGVLGVNDDGGSDKYYKGSNLLHMLRQLVNDDTRWRSILRGLNEEFRHSIVPSPWVEGYISRESGMDLGVVFDQYLRTTQIPVLEWQMNGRLLSYRWADTLHGFAMPVRVSTAAGRWQWIRPTGMWQVLEVDPDPEGAFAVDPDFYVLSRQVRVPEAGVPPAPDGSSRPSFPVPGLPPGTSPPPSGPGGP